MKRVNKEITLNEINNNFSIKFGTVNSSNKNAIYVFGSTYITPVINKECYSEDVFYIKKSIKFMIKDLLRKYKEFESKFMLDIDIRDSGIKINKKSYMSLELHLLRKDTFDKLSDISDNMKEILMELFMGINTILNKNAFKNYKCKTK